MNIQETLISAGFSIKNEAKGGKLSQVIEVQLSPTASIKPGEIEHIQNRLCIAGKNIHLSTLSAKIYRLCLTLLLDYGSESMQKWAKCNLILLGESQLRALYQAHASELDTSRRGDTDLGHLCRFRYILKTRVE